MTDECLQLTCNSGERFDDVGDALHVVVVVGNRGREKLDEYFASVRQLEQRMAPAESG